MKCWRKQANIYTKFFITTIPLSFFVCIFFWFASQPLILTFYTSDYINSISILKILVIGSSFFLIALPLCSIILSLNKPQILVAVDLLVLIVMLAGNLLLIPVYGAIGAGIAVLFSKLVFLIIIVVLVIKEVSKIPV